MNCATLRSNKRRGNKGEMSNDRKSFRGIKSKRGIVARPVRPNIAAKARYLAKLDALIQSMGKSATYWVKAAYGKTDLKSVPKLDRYLKRLNRKYNAKFDELAETAPKQFVNSIHKNATSQLRTSIKDATGATATASASNIPEQPH